MTDKNIPENDLSMPLAPCERFEAPLGDGLTYGFAGRRIACVISPHQTIDIVDLVGLGRAYRLDGRFMASLTDAHICHECMVHPLFLTHGSVRRVLVIGGGDGGSAREALRYPAVQEVVIAELDAKVVDAVRTYLPGLADGAFDDSRTTLVIGDAAEYVERAIARGEHFDAVIFDLTEADGMAAALHDAPFFGRIKALLAPGGAVSLQLGAPWHQADLVARQFDALQRTFAVVRPMTAFVPLYGALWALAIASDTLDPTAATLASPETLAQAAQRLNAGGWRHYAPSRHAVLFDWPPELRAIVDGTFRPG